MTPAVETYTATRIGFDRTPAADAVRLLAERVADALGTGTFDPDTRDVDGLLEAPVFVTEGGVFGLDDAVTLSGPRGEVLVVLDDDALPLQQLVALLGQLHRYCISRAVR
jgi:hypothetical protein